MVVVVAVATGARGAGGGLAGVAGMLPGDFEHSSRTHASHDSPSGM